MWLNDCDVIGRGVLGLPEGMKVIITARNPLDACVSSYYHAFNPYKSGWPFDGKTTSSFLAVLIADDNLANLSNVMLSFGVICLRSTYSRYSFVAFFLTT
jgi:hypothetical protein